MIYSDKVMDHFNHPRNVGIIEDADGVGTVGNPVCGDIMKMYLKIDDGIITDDDTGVVPTQTPMADTSAKPSASAQATDGAAKK